MTRQFGALFIALLLVFSVPLAAQKREQKKALPSAQSKPIRFQGAAQYTPEELLAAAGLKADAKLSFAEVKAHAKQLNDTGLFELVKFVSDRQGVLFALTPAAQLYPMHLDNLPLTPGKDLDARLHERFPLYHGQLPGAGSIVDGLCRSLEEMLAAKGMQATVKAALTSGLGPSKITAVNFSIASPAVHIGKIQLSGVSSVMQPKAVLVAVGQMGNDFDTENSALGLRHAYEDLYQDLGYAAVQIDVAQLDPVIAAGQPVEIPFKVTIREGGIYTLGKIEYPAGALVARAEAEKVQAKYPASSARPLDLFLLAVRDAHHAHGYLDCAVTTHASFNEATHIVNYALEVTPGAQYRLGSVKFDGAPEAMGAKLKAAWKMAAGDVFDESYLGAFPALAQKKDKQLTKWLLTVIATTEVKPDVATHQVACIFHFAKAAQSGR